MATTYTHTDYQGKEGDRWFQSDDYSILFSPSSPACYGIGSQDHSSVLRFTGVFFGS